MMDYFCEYMIRRKKSGKDIAIIIGLILAGIILTIVLFPLMFYQLVGSFMLLAIVGVWYGAYILISGRNIEYEYTVTNGDLDVDSIAARRKRKRVISVKGKEIELLAPVMDEKFRREFENVNITKVIDASTGVISENTYFAVFVKDAQRTKLLFEPSDKMLRIFKRFRPQAVFVNRDIGEEA